MRVVGASVWIVYATAQAHGAELLTCDARFAKLPAVAYFKQPTPG